MMYSVVTTLEGAGRRIVLNRSTCTNMRLLWYYAFDGLRKTKDKVKTCGEISLQNYKSSKVAVQNVETKNNGHSRLSEFRSKMYNNCQNY